MPNSRGVMTWSHFVCVSRVDTGPIYQKKKREFVSIIKAGIVMRCFQT
jgi:hypothetical protein